MTRGRRRTFRRVAWKDIPDALLPEEVRVSLRRKAPKPKPDEVRCTCIGQWQDPDCPNPDHNDGRFI